MITYIKKNPIKIIFILLFVIFQYLNYSGFCYDQQRFLSDEELIEIAVIDQVASRQIKIDGSADSIRTFYTKHPNCCRVIREGISPISSAFGSHYVEVRIIYELNKLHRDGEYYDDTLVISACGQVVEEYGTRRHKEHLPSWFN